MDTTNWIGSSIRLVRDVDAVATLLDHLRKSAQGLIYTITSDENVTVFLTVLLVHVFLQFK